MKPLKISLAALTLLVSALALSACVSAPNYGDYPTNYESVIDNYFHETLDIPESAWTSKFSIPRTDWLWEADLYFGKEHYGWLVCADVYTKNSDNDYAGRASYFFILRGDNIIFTQKTSEKFPLGPYIECQFANVIL